MFLGLFDCLFAFIQGLVEKIYIWAVRRRPSIIIAQEGVLRDYLYSIHLIHTLPRPPPPNSRRNGGWPEEASCCALLSYFSKIFESIIYHYSEKHGPTSEKVTARKRSKIMLTESSFLSHFIRNSLSFVLCTSLNDWSKHYKDTIKVILGPVEQLSCRERWMCNTMTAINHSSVKMDFFRLLTLVLSVLFVGKVLSFLI